MLVKTFCAAVNGLEATTVTVEVSLTRGVMFHLTGLADTAVRESHDRIVAALQNNGYKFPVADITVNMAPADLRKEGSGYDLPLAIGILAANGKVESAHLHEYMLIGELGLDGRLQPVRGALPIAIKARAEKFKGLIVPKQNIREAAVVNNIDVYGAETIMDIISEIGEMPLPPYITEKLKDKERYQTVYSKEIGSAAAPTAGLHFTDDLLDRIRAKGIKIAFVTLHVGLGTFRPVKVENITEHKMHTEHYYLPQVTADIINETKSNGGRVIAVGTTSCRTVESAADENGVLQVKGKSLCVKKLVNGNEAVTGEWFDTGDMVTCRDGNYFIHGRKSDTVIGEHGENINPDINDIRQLKFVDSITIIKSFRTYLANG